MIIGVDAGGTNTDGVLISNSKIIDKTKVPSTPNNIEGIKKVLKNLTQNQTTKSIKRIVIGTTLILNSVVEDKMGECGSLIIPGPGLSTEIAKKTEYNEIVNGYIDHRGRKVEKLDTDKIKEFKDRYGDQVDSFAVAGKFSTRNPELEKKAASILDDKPVSIGSEIASDLGFPIRTSTTILNAKSLPIFRGFTQNIDQVLSNLGINAPIYYIKSDGAMIDQSTAPKIPSMTIKSGPAVSTLGLFALTGVSNALAIDIGGTTTDLGIISDGNLRREEKLSIKDYDTFFSSIESVDIPLGGDSLVKIQSGEIKIKKSREGRSAAFGGDQPTLTDALHVLDEFNEGNKERSLEVITKLSTEINIDPIDLSRKIVSKFSSEISKITRNFIENHESLHNQEKITFIGGGVLSRYMVPRISKKLNQDYIIPECSEVAGAIGSAVSKVSIKTGIHIDTAQGKMTVNGERKKAKKGKKYDEEELFNLAKNETIKVSKNSGLRTEKEEVQIKHMRYFNVVDHRKVQGQICDVEAQINPGITNEVDLNKLRG